MKPKMSKQDQILQYLIDKVKPITIWQINQKFNTNNGTKFISNLRRLLFYILDDSEQLAAYHHSEGSKQKHYWLVGKPSAKKYLREKYAIKS